MSNPTPKQIAKNLLSRVQNVSWQGDECVANYKSQGKWLKGVISSVVKGSR